LRLGDLDAQRDWGYAKDCVDAMWRIVQCAEPGDYVIATGELHSVRELTEIAFTHVGLDWQAHVRVDDTLKRGQAELHHLVGDAAKARRTLGWQPTIGFEALVQLLVDAAVTRLTSS
jgi:GDPmannose 4,6-dehydratase